MKEKDSQCKTILEYLKEGHSITQIEASDKFRITRLAARISDLKKRGYDIVSEEVGKGFGRYVRYHLAYE
jgi:predicted ArsR family transcriptional regulator